MSDPKVIGGYMAFTLLIGSAVRTGGPDIRERIRREIIPMLRDKTVTMPEVTARFIEIVGPDWTADEETNRMVDSLLK